jgi:glucose-6-phosphate isomerase
MVGHYWLRAPERAPRASLASEIRAAQEAVMRFAADVRAGRERTPAGSVRHVLHVGIGGSAVGPAFLCDALAAPDGVLCVHVIDNADPDGLDRVLRRVGAELDRTLVSVVSKSGVTPTPMAVLCELETVYARHGLDLAQHALATTMAGTPLHERARQTRWRAWFPLWDWVGGRTSATSAVGLLPAALAGADVRAFLAGAAAMDELARVRDLAANPAAVLAATWHVLGGGRGNRAMVLLPYRDRLALLGRHVQQLVMESLGKRTDRAGHDVFQGLTVYGHKGATDQHSYLQQLVDGRDDAFVLLVTVDDERDGEPLVIDDVTLGDRLFANLAGTRRALSARGRSPVTITVRDAGPFSVGLLIALFERAVGIYAELVDVNAYHQPAVDKFAGADVLALQRRATAFLRARPGRWTAEEIAEGIDAGGDAALVQDLLRRLAASGRRGITTVRGHGASPQRFAATAPDPRGAAR